LPERITAGSSVLKGFGAALVSGAVAYALAVYLPGNAILTALVWMSVGGLIALPFISRELRLLFNL
jgi:hypothetical protein